MRQFLFSIVQGAMWALLAEKIGYKIDDYRWWLIAIPGCYLLSVLYNKLKN